MCNSPIKLKRFIEIQRKKNVRAHVTFSQLYIVFASWFFVVVVTIISHQNVWKFGAIEIDANHIRVNTAQ